MNPLHLKVIAIGLNVLGTAILAIRVTMILNALSTAIKVHETNIQQLMGNNPIIVNFTNAHNFVDVAKKTGIKLLILGFGFVIVGNILTGISILLN